MADFQAPLSERETEVLRLVATGASNQEIARDLVISVNTVKVHLRNTFEKLGVQSRTEATLYAIQHGLVVVNGVESVPVTEEEAAPRVSRPLAWWQRVYALAATALALTLLLASIFWREEPATAAVNPISDQPVVDVASVRAETSRWTNFADLPTPRTRLALVAFDERLFAIGGDRAGGVSDLVEIYSPETDTWSTGRSKPTPVSNVAGVAVGKLIYVPGGCTGPTTATDRLEVYDPSNDEWSGAASMPMPVCAYALAAVDDTIYVFGGWDGGSFVDRVFSYRPTSDTWSEEEPGMPVAMGFSAAVAVNDVIYVVGGYDGINELADVYAYDVAARIYTPRSSMNVPRGGLGVATVGGNLYAIGGGWQSYLATNERYDPTTDTWSVFESPVVGEWRNLGVAALGAQVYAVGGWNEGYLGVNEAYQAIFRIILPVTQ